VEGRVTMDGLDMSPETMLWTAASLWAVFVLTSAPGRSQLANVFSKVRLGGSVVAHLLLSGDRKWKKSAVPNPDAVRQADAEPVRTKRIIFIRHGESDWNEVFNRGFGPMFPVRVLVGLVREFFKLSTLDSLFVDSPLSSLGVRQARALQAHIENTALSGGGGQAERALATLRGFGGSAVLVSSNLRRALATAVIGLWGRLAQGDRLLVLSELQEISRNPDTLALAPPGGVPDLDSLFSQLGPQFHYGVLDGSTHNGSKPLRGNGLTRLTAFANWVFTRSEDTVVATGHSLYFKHFFNTFLPADATGVAAAARSKKMTNCGMVTFTLECSRVGGRTVHRIDPASVCVLYGKIG